MKKKITKIIFIFFFLSILLYLYQQNLNKEKQETKIKTSLPNDNLGYNSNVLKEPEPRVRFRKFSSSGLKLQLLFWIFKPAIRGRTVDEINTKNYRQFSENNITIPYPTMNLLMKEK